MALKTLFNTIKREGYVVKYLDQYLYSLNEKDADRAIDVNAPSASGTCMRARFYSRTQAERDVNTIDPRTRRIFDNGHGVHARLQTYLEKQGMLLMDEVPVHNTEYNIQGHTDGILALTSAERGILEIKSINSNGFASLKDAKEEHKMQGLNYIYCVEERRKTLQKKYKSLGAFKLNKAKRMNEYRSLYQHLKDGRKHTREEKIEFQASLHDKMDNILFVTKIPITKAVFLYENKDTQDLKEFLVTTTDAQAKVLLKDILEDYTVLNNYVKQDKIPPRCARIKSDPKCRWCAYKTECWN